MTMTRTETETTIIIDADYGLVDDKGRAIGGQATIGKEQASYNDQPADSPLIKAVPSLRGYPLQTQATRAGHPFGVASFNTYHSSVADAEAYAQRQLAAQHKRFAKRYAPRRMPL